MDVKHTLELVDYVPLTSSRNGMMIIGNIVISAIENTTRRIEKSSE